jgi:hypothetical protein
MSDTKPRAPQALQAVLSRKNIEIFCTLVFEDESVSYPTVSSVSLRGAQRQITGWLVAHGYMPIGRWSEGDLDGDGYTEWTRAFKPGTDAAIGTTLMIAGIEMTDSRAPRPESV